MRKAVLSAAVFCGLAVLPVMLTERALTIPRERRPVPDASRAKDIAGTSVSEWREVSIQSIDGAALKGWTFTPPPAHDSGKAVMLLHGAGDSRRGMLGFAGFFVRHGFTTLVTDSRAHGISGGDQVTYGLIEKQDVRRWADYLLSRKPGAQLYGLGMSMGAAVLIQALDVEPRFRSLVAECPYATFRDAAEERIPRLTGLPPFFAPPIVGAAFFYARLRYGLDLAAISPVESIRRAATPTLLIHGLADDRTAPEQSRLLHAANPRVTELWEVPGAKHVQASVVAQKEFEERVMRWFQK